MDVLDKINEVLEDYVEWHGSADAADSAADDLDQVAPCMNCGWEPDGEPHADDECDYQPDLPAEGTSEFAILDWPHYQWMHECRFSADAEDNADDRRWVLAEYTIKPGAEEGFYAPVGHDKMLTRTECQELAEQRGCSILG